MKSFLTLNLRTTTKAQIFQHLLDTEKDRDEWMSTAKTEAHGHKMIEADKKCLLDHIDVLEGEIRQLQSEAEVMRQSKNDMKKDAKKALVLQALILSAEIKTKSLRDVMADTEIPRRPILPSECPF